MALINYLPRDTKEAAHMAFALAVRYLRAGAPDERVHCFLVDLGAKHAAQIIEGAHSHEKPPPTVRLLPEQLAYYDAQIGCQPAHGAALHALYLSEVEPQQARFLQKPYIPLAEVTVATGDPGVGKSTAIIAFGIPVARDGGTVLLIDAENDPAFALRPRMDRMLADEEAQIADAIRSRFAVVELRSTEGVALDDGIVLDAAGLDLIEDLIGRERARMVVIDPWSAFVGAAVNTDKANHTRPIFTRLRRIAAKHDSAIIVVRHATKSDKTRAIFRGQGSVDITGAARSELYFVVDPHDSTKRKRAIFHVKCNVAAEGAPLGYEIREGRFTWTKTDLSLSEALGPETDTESPHKVEQAKELLKQLLGKPGSVVPSDQLNRAAEDEGISAKTMQRARKEMGVQRRDLPRGKGGRVSGYEYFIPEATQDGMF